MRKTIAFDGMEALPEADCLSGFPHPRLTFRVFGQQRAEQSFLSAYQSGRLHHAWLLTGPAGIGKATFAYRLARFLLSDDEEKLAPEGSLDIEAGSLTDRQIATLSHSRLLLIRRPYDAKAKKFATTIPVNEVRRLKTFVGTTADQNAWRVVIVDDANELNINAANALLKSLEEPPRQTLFLLVAPEPGRLLATIRSRCRKLTLSGLERGDLLAAARQALEASNDAALGMGDASELNEAIADAAGGSVRRALQLLAHDSSDLAKRLARLFEQLPDVDWRAVQDLADQLAKPGNEQSFELAFDLFQERIAGVVRAQTLGDVAPSIQKKLAARIGSGALASWAKLWERVARERVEAQTLNLDRKSLIVRVVGDLAETAALSSQGARDDPRV